ncbi:hypothetical protein [Nucisporomicrobium flavum]|uniref:hypothetical protein n=1 Tax=Nucisporomicrobium flavum TaxID=2785915 RepID=UPI0018F5B103|nr:hypothetical protein [Nucisporomicrobium flavum]
MQKPDLSEEQRAAAARVAAMVDRVSAGGPASDPASALPALRAISRDPVVLGDALGDYLHRVVAGPQSDTIRYWPALELLRAAGADEERAAAKAAWLRSRTTT